MRLACIILATVAIVAVMLFIALSDVLTPRAKAQSDGGDCLKVTMEEAEAAFTLHLVDDSGRRLGLSNRQIGRSITRRNMDLDTPIYIQIEETGDIIRDPNKIEIREHVPGSHMIVGYEDDTDDDFDDAVIRKEMVACPPSPPQQPPPPENTDTPTPTDTPAPTPTDTPTPTPTNTPTPETPQYSVSLSIGNSRLSVGDSTTLFAAQSGTVVNSWSLTGASGGLSLSSSSSSDTQVTWNATAVAPGSYTLTFRASCIEGGTRSDSASVEVVEPPTPTFTPTPTPDDDGGNGGGGGGSGTDPKNPTAEPTSVAPSDPSPAAPTSAVPSTAAAPPTEPPPTAADVQPTGSGPGGGIGGGGGVGSGGVGGGSGGVGGTGRSPVGDATPTHTPTATPKPTSDPADSAALVATPTPTATPTATPTPTPTPTPVATPTITPSPTATPTLRPDPAATIEPSNLGGPNIPIIGDAVPRVRDALSNIVTTPRQRNTLIIVLAVVGVLVILVFVYLIWRRR